MSRRLKSYLQACMHALISKSYIKQQQQQLQGSISGKGKPVSSLFPCYVVQAAGMSPARPQLDEPRPGMSPAGPLLGDSLLGESPARLLESALGKSALSPLVI